MLKEKAKIEAIIGKKYDIKSQISAGGMGKIYLGIHRSLNKRVAIKIIHQEFRKDETFRKRFYREARLAANLDHPGIVDIYDFGSSENFDYIIMPFIDGETLKEKLKREKRLPISKSLDLMAAITSALSFAHNNNVVHRDIKPSNILIDKQEHAYLTDFGISKDLGDVDLTLPDTVMGSPKYISPEQITGKKVDGRCDLYALGFIFYEMVTGVYPYAGRDANAIYYAQVNEVPQRPDQVNPDIPGAVSDIIMKLIEKPPEHRYQKGSEVLQDIANVKSAYAPVQSSKAEAPIIDRGSIDNIRDNDGDLPTVVNIHRSDKSRLFDNKPIVVESTDSGAKLKSMRFSPWQLISLGSGLVFLVIIGYFVLYKPSPRTDTLAVRESLHESVPVTLNVSLISLIKQFKTIGESQDAKFIRLWTKKNVYKIGDSIGYHFQASQDCYLIVILFSSSGEIIQVFPNRYYPDAFISTGDTYDIPSPDSDIKLKVTGPPGIEELLALASDKPLNILPLNTEELPFFVVDGTDPSLLKRIHDKLNLAKKMNLKHKIVKYAIAK